MPELSRGQTLALEQLSEIAERSGGALEIRGEPEEASAGYIWVRLSLETKRYRTAEGLPFRDRERLSLHLHPDFPFAKPDLYFGHRRFIGRPHIQWGSYICLYQSSETEYEPSDGMFGFFDRVEHWMTAAGRGRLDPEDAPLHPPVAYTTSATSFVTRRDTPELPKDSSYWLGRADLRKVRNGRFDVTGWTALEDWGDTNPGHPIAAAVLFNQPLAMEYPSKVVDLRKLIEAAGMSFETLYSLLRIFALIVEEGEPAYFILGAPMRRKAPGEPLRPHLTVWQIEADTLATLRDIIRSAGQDEVARDKLVTWMIDASVTWCEVLEDRPEVVQRRDGGTVVSGLSGKRVLLLGCGALGSATAETIVRSGAARLHLVDVGRVKPGVLVRQRFSDADIGLPKATALQARLESLGLECVVTSEVTNLAAQAFTRFDLDEWDLIIDATASVNVAHRMEEELKATELAVPLISLSVSAAAENGSVATKMPAFRSGPHHIARRAKLEAFAKHAGQPLVKAFWPDRGTLRIFQPEPGCGAPTFVGSAADIDHHAAGLLNIGLLRVQTLEANEASLDLVAAPWLELARNEQRRLGYLFRTVPATTEQNHGYTVLRSDIARAGMAAELRRIARTRSDKVETGGLLFGEIDDAHQAIWIDSVSGPPPDSRASAEQFLCGTAGTKNLAAAKAKASGDSSRFIGIWHTHPVSRGRPSQDDLQAMVQLLHLQEATPRHVLMLIVGYAATQPEENYYLYRRNQFFLIQARDLASGSGE